MLHRRLVALPSSAVITFSGALPLRHFTNVLTAICVTTCDKLKDAWLTTSQQKGVALYPASLHDHTSSSRNIIPTSF